MAARRSRLMVEEVGRLNGTGARRLRSLGSSSHLDSQPQHAGAATSMNATRPEIDLKVAPRPRRVAFVSLEFYRMRTTQR